MATRFSATAAAIGLVGVVLGASSAAAADAAGRLDTPGLAVPAAVGGVPLLSPLDAGSTGIRVAADKIRAGAVAVADSDTAVAPVLAAAVPASRPTTSTTPENHRAKLPFHKTGKKARSLPETGVPMSATLGAVTALTALLAGVGTVVAARPRPDHEA